MNFRDLQENLRLELLRRIDRGVLSGSLLARQTGMRPAHISNVLNQKRHFSTEGLDRILAAQNISIEQIVPKDLSGHRKKPRRGETVPVPIVSSSAALYQPRLAAIRSQILYIPAAQLAEKRSRASALRSHWERYAALVLDQEQAEPMHPLLSPGAVAIIDRYHVSLASCREPHPALYAVSYDGRLHFRFVSIEDNQLILRPSNEIFPVRLFRLRSHDEPANHIIGRVCLLLSSV